VTGRIQMSNTARFTSGSVDMYHRDGFTVLKVFDENEVCLLERFARGWIYRLLGEWTADKENQYPLETYHVWSKSFSIDHGNVFRAPNRHTNPPKDVANVLINDRLKDFLGGIGLKRYRIWDEGLGWLAFRFVRPGMGDGYPLSRKAWGIATSVVSCWVPIIGYGPVETLALVPGSHLKEYDKYLPTDSKFCKGEYRLSDKYKDLEIFRPKLERGEIVVFHPNTLHSEDVSAGSLTRLNLEFRIDTIPADT
jgi:hypothetical protein